MTSKGKRAPRLTKALREQTTAVLASLVAAHPALRAVRDDYDAADGLRYRIEHEDASAQRRAIASVEAKARWHGKMHPVFSESGVLVYFGGIRHYSTGRTVTPQSSVLIPLGKILAPRLVDRLLKHVKACEDNIAAAEEYRVARDRRTALAATFDDARLEALSGSRIRVEFDIDANELDAVLKALAVFDRETTPKT